MLVQHGDWLRRGDRWYSVVCADKQTFVLAEAQFDEYLKRRCVSYKNLEAYCNDETVNTLEDLRFIKEEQNTWL